MLLDSAHVKIVTQKGDCNPIAPSTGDKSQLTVVARISAEGEVSGTGYVMSAKVWIDQELLDGWFTNHFLNTHQ